MYYILGQYDKDYDKVSYPIIRFSYRLGFWFLGETWYVSDIGWGCTIRSTQMMIANTLLKSVDNKNKKKYFQVLALFSDNPYTSLSIHNFCYNFKHIDKKIGNWIGPYSACIILEYLLPRLFKTYDITYINFRNNNINISENIEFPIFITLQVRLGIDDVDENYYQNIIYLTKNPYFRGIIGGSLNKSYYIIGSKEKKLIYIDPHITYYYNNKVYNNSEYHNTTLKTLDRLSLAPTMSFGFYFTNKNQLDYFRKINLNIPNPKYPIFSFDNLKYQIVENMSNF